VTGKRPAAGYEIEFFGRADGSEPVRKFLDSLSEDKRDALLATLKFILARSGLDVCKSEWGKNLGGGLAELRLRHDEREVLAGYSDTDEEELPVIKPLSRGGYAHPVAPQAWGLTQAELAERAGLSQADISRYERGLGNPTRTTIEGIAAVLGAHLELVRDYLDDTTCIGGRTPEDLLTTREREVVKLIAEGHSTDEIAVRLTLSKKTVERHRANVLDRLGVRDQVVLGL
jgi:DNA-binding CsgD family transcriptional regulator/DNA-binding XRE family transcriptional regulator